MAPLNQRLPSRLRTKHRTDKRFKELFHHWSYFFEEFKSSLSNSAEDLWRAIGHWIWIWERYVINQLIHVWSSLYQLVGARFQELQEIHRSVRSVLGTSRTQKSAKSPSCRRDRTKIHRLFRSRDRTQRPKSFSMQSWANVKLGEQTPAVISTPLCSNGCLCTQLDLLHFTSNERIRRLWPK